ncbi:BBE domain-containing protein [Amycolatopsis saalfeldensis]|uniref:BBE domain-containing protein n=1 Tax=Amycolatopsis saalfeldensis TaxID=394193 RepID=UPI003CCC230B
MLVGPSRRRLAPGVVARVLPRRVHRDRRRTGSERGHRRLLRQLPGRRPGRPGVEHLGCSVVSLYYKENYPRLQWSKGRDDPRGLFRHAPVGRAGLTLQYFSRVSAARPG